MSEYIAELRYATPGVELISPPPHHDIYSIEDLAQLIHDLKNANRRASISVKLVSEIGVGTIAAGVAKAKSDHVTIAGHDGGTGASPWSSIKHAGTPWELGLAETQQTLVLNRLRGRIAVQVDGQMKTGRDVAIGAILGADEFGFATAPLVVSGCIMMRKCHLNTCPVGVATQDPVLRRKFRGQPEHVINFFFFVAEELREIMAKLGVRKLDDLIGRTDLLDMRDGIAHWKARGLDFAKIFYMPKMPPEVAVYNSERQDHGLEKALDNRLIELAEPALERGEKVTIEMPIRNINRTVGTMLSHEIARRYGHEGLPDETIHVRFAGSAGQSFGAFLAQGVWLDHIGDTNDYCGKGLSGGRISVQPSAKFRGEPTENIITGNVVLYGAICRRGVLPRRRRRAVRGAQLRRAGGDRGRRRPRLRVHDRRHRRRPRHDRAEFRRRHVGRDRLRARRRRPVRQALQPVDGRPRGGADRVRAAGQARARPVAPRHGRRGHPEAADRAPGEVHRQRAGEGDPRRLGEAPDEVREGVSEGIPARAGGERRRCAEGGRLMGKTRWVKSPASSSTSASPEAYEAPEARKKHWREFIAPLGDEEAKIQGARCMDCGMPFCMSGCPVNNIIPDFNDLVYRADWKRSIETLHSTNNFPEFTGRVCPAPCEEACTLRINDDAVGIKSIEHAIIDKAWDEGWVKPQPASHRTGKKVAVVGSGPAGLACAQQLARAGHAVTVSRRTTASAGCSATASRTSRWRSGSSTAGSSRCAPRASSSGRACSSAPRRRAPASPNDAQTTVAPDQLLAEFDAVVLAGGAEQPRDLPVPGRELAGIHYAMEFLPLQNRRVAGDKGIRDLWATDKHVVVIGGGDTGSDCVGTSNRHGAKSITQFELLPMPPDLDRNPVWPYWPSRLRRPPRTRKAASATGRWRRSTSAARTARSRRSWRCAWSGRRTRRAAR